MDIPLDSRVRQVGEVAVGLISLANDLAKAAARRVVRTPAPRNATLRPGPDTPMWNALVLAVRPHLRRRGEKTNLGRELGVPPQRIHEYFVARTAAPDAERTLCVMRWLAARAPLTGEAAALSAPRRKATRRSPLFT